MVKKISPDGVALTIILFSLLLDNEAAYVRRHSIFEFLVLSLKEREIYTPNTF